MRRQGEDVERVHQVGRVATKTEKPQLVEKSLVAGTLFEFLPQHSAADNPELGRRKAAENRGDCPNRSRWPFFSDR